MEGPRQDATCSAQEDNIRPFIFNINKRLGLTTEKRIKERYCWQQADKEVIKAVRNSDKIQRTKKMRAGGGE